MTTPARATTGVLLALGAVLVLLSVGLSTPVAAQATNDTATGNVSFGAQVSSFMQSTAAEANDTVDRGMWRASVDDSDRPAAAVDERTEQLQDRLSALENRTGKVAADGAGPPDIVYTARASALRARLAALRESIDETATVAQRHGVDDADLATLRERAGSVEGPAVADAARNLTDAGRGPPEDVTPGPSAERGPPGNRTAGPPGNDTRADPGERGPDDRGPPAGPDEDAPPADEDGGESSDGAGPPGGGGDGGPPENGGQGGPADSDRDGPPGDGDDAGRSGDAGNSGTGGGSSGGDAGNSGTGGGPSGGDGGPPGDGDGQSGDGPPGNGGAGPGASE